jgi:hypothetical protein
VGWQIIYDCYGVATSLRYNLRPVSTASTQRGPPASIAHPHLSAQVIHRLLEGCLLYPTWLGSMYALEKTVSEEEAERGEKDMHTALQGRRTLSVALAQLLPALS